MSKQTTLSKFLLKSNESKSLQSNASETKCSSQSPCWHSRLLSDWDAFSFGDFPEWVTEECKAKCRKDEGKPSRTPGLPQKFPPLTPLPALQSSSQNPSIAQVPLRDQIDSTPKGSKQAEISPRLEREVKHGKDKGEAAGGLQVKPTRKRKEPEDGLDDEQRAKLAKTLVFRHKQPCPWPGCGKIVGNMSNHKRTHTKETPFKCPHEMCGMSFNTSGNLQKHRMIHVDERPFICTNENCGKAFREKSHLKKHIRVHTGERPFECNFEDCRKRFSENRALQDHIRVHTGEKPFVCPVGNCGAAFASNSNLSVHRRVHTGEKPYVCPQCHKAFSAKGNLDVHMQFHAGFKPFECTFKECNGAFVRKYDLSVHMRVHTGEKPFVCSFEGCGRAFSATGARKKHERIHSGERPFICPFERCDKAFRTSGNLQDHIRVHTGEKPFVCQEEGCSLRFSRAHHLQGHHFSFHTPEGKAQRKKSEERYFDELRKQGETPRREVYITRSHRVDGLTETGDRVTIYELQENQHRDRDVDYDPLRAESIRKITDPKRALELHFYNPHGQRIDGVTQKQVYEESVAKFVKFLRDPNRPRPHFAMFYHRYNLVNGELEVLSHPDYPEGMKKFAFIGT